MGLSEQTVTASGRQLMPDVGLGQAVGATQGLAAADCAPS